MNFYTVLGVSRDADDDAIRRAYRMLVRRYHPDQGIGSSAEKFREVREAYKTLIDPANRRSYDLWLQRVAGHRAIGTEPIAPQSWPLHQEDPGVFGRFRGAGAHVGPIGTHAQHSIRLCLILVEALLNEDEWPW